MILIVDDNPENIFSLKSLLTLHKYEVDTASSGEEALKKILLHPYTLVILDVQMPDMDGFEVAEALSGYSKSKDIPIIFLSAINTHKKFITKGYDSGGIDYVTKPFDPDILLLKIKTFNRLSNQTRQLHALEKSLREEIELRKEAEVILEKKVEERTQELRKSNQRLQQSNEELQQFAFVTSHDLQEPLRKIQTFSNLALEHLEQGQHIKIQTYLDKIFLSAKRLRTLITDLLDYSRLNVQNAFVSANLRDIVLETLNDLESLSKTVNPVINVQAMPSIDMIPFQMRQVFQNLLSNAMKFRKEDTPCIITVNGTYVSEKDTNAPSIPLGNYYKITLADNGIGFDEMYAAKIFDIFHRLNRKEQYEGTGIGLAIVKKVIERHDGIISAHSSPSGGATFTMVLPVKYEEHDRTT